jgi:hypothetical protein
VRGASPPPERAAAPTCPTAGTGATAGALVPCAAAANCAEKRSISPNAFAKRYGLLRTSLNSVVADSAPYSRTLSITASRRSASLRMYVLYSAAALSKSSCTSPADLPPAPASAPSAPPRLALDRSASPATAAAAATSSVIVCLGPDNDVTAASHTGMATVVMSPDSDSGRSPRVAAPPHSSASGGTSPLTM